MITKLELRRQLVHITLGVILMLTFFFELVPKYFLIIATFGTLLASIFLKTNIHIPIVDLILRRFQRKSEKQGMPLKGAFFYFLGSTIVLYTFPKMIALASIAILAFGDSISRLVGPYGYLKHPYNNKKFIEGIIAGGITATLGGWIFVPIQYAFLASIVAMLLEGLDIEINGMKVDDNLTIPLAASLTIYLLLLL